MALSVKFMNAIKIFGLKYGSLPLVWVTSRTGSTVD
jgi:hypothetical protein